MKHKWLEPLLAACAMPAALLAFTLVPLHAGSAVAQEASLTFPETAHSITGRFLDYWQQHGGLAVQGYPISQPLSEKSDTDGKVYTVQYFERAVFEYHPENQAPNDVLLALLGVNAYRQKYAGNPPVQLPNSESDSRLFSETGKHAGGLFLQYWQQHGGLEQLGFPISEEFPEISDLNHRAYKVQYFQRGELEYHPENQAPYNVLMSQLGTLRYNALHRSGETGSPSPSPTGAPEPPATATSVPPSTPTAAATATPGPVYKVKVSVSNPRPHQNEVVYVTGKLTRDGGPVAYVLMDAVWQFSNGTMECKAYTNKDGIAECSRNIGAARLGRQVDIYITFRVSPTVDIETGTSFTPR